jgi:hypothetical protein
MASNQTAGPMSCTSGTGSRARSSRNVAGSNDCTKTGASGRSSPAARRSATTGSSSGVPHPAM